MDIRPGYKLTEVGVIPDDWDVKRLGQLGGFLKGRGVTRGESATGNLACIRYGELYTRHNNHIKNFHSWISREVATTATRLEHGDILFAGSGETKEEIGKSAAFADDVEAYAGGDIVILRNKKADPLFLGYYLNTGPINKQKASKGQGDAIVHIGTEALASIQCALPHPSEQAAIAEALSDADALIESLEQLLTKKRQIKKGAMQELLTGRTRLPGFSGDWKIKRLGQLGGFLKGRGVTRDESATGDLACVRYGELYTRHDNHIETYYSWISREVATTATRLEHGDVLFAGSGETKDEIGKCASFVDNMEAYAGGDIVILRNKKADPIFLGYYLNTGPINRQKASKGQGDAIVHIGAEALTDIQCTLPDLSEQTAIATILSDMDAGITALEAKLSKARQLKQGMMQELLTGRIRLL